MLSNYLLLLFCFFVFLLRLPPNCKTGGGVFGFLRFIIVALFFNGISSSGFSVLEGVVGTVLGDVNVEAVDD